MVFSIPAFWFYDPLLDHAQYIVGSDRDTRVAFGALLEICLAICGIATAVVIFPIAKRVNECVALGYVASRTVESILILVGVLSLMSIVGLRQDDLLLGLVIGFAAFAVLNTLMLAIRGRSREYALLQLVGASRLQVRRMMRIEALLLIIVGWAVGSAVAAATLMPFAYAVSGSFLPHFPPLQVGAVLLSTAALAWVATMVPTRGTMRTRPVEAIGIRD